MGLKRSSGDNVDVESSKAIYKRAKNAYKQDKSNDALKLAKNKAKKALKEAESILATAATADVTDSQTSSSSDQNDDIPNVVRRVVWIPTATRRSHTWDRLTSDQRDVSRDIFIETVLIVSARV